MNKVFLIGNATQDPVLSETVNGVQICKFSLAVVRNYNCSEEERITDFFNCIAWRGLAETIARYVRKGNKLAINGSLEIRNYEDRKGIKRTSVDVLVQDIEFLSSRQANERTIAPENKKPEIQSFENKKPVLQSFIDDGDIPF